MCSELLLFSGLTGGWGTGVTGRWVFAGVCDFCLITVGVICGGCVAAAGAAGLMNNIFCLFSDSAGEFRSYVFTESWDLIFLTKITFLECVILRDCLLMILYFLIFSVKLMNM